MSDEERDRVHEDTLIRERLARLEVKVNIVAWIGGITGVSLLTMTGAILIKLYFH